MKKKPSLGPRWPQAQFATNPAHAASSMDFFTGCFEWRETRGCQDDATIIRAAPRRSPSPLSAPTRRLIAPDSARFVLYPDDCPDPPTEHDARAPPADVEEFNWAAMLNVLTARPVMSDSDASQASTFSSSASSEGSEPSRSERYIPQPLTARGLATSAFTETHEAMIKEKKAVLAQLKRKEHEFARKLKKKEQIELEVKHLQWKHKKAASTKNSLYKHDELNPAELRRMHSYDNAVKASHIAAITAARQEVIELRDRVQDQRKVVQHAMKSARGNGLPLHIDTDRHRRGVDLVQA